MSTPFNVIGGNSSATVRPSSLCNSSDQGRQKTISLQIAAIMAAPAPKMTYVDMVKSACVAIGGKSFGGKFSSRGAIKAHLKSNFGYTDSGMAKLALKSALKKFEKKGDSFRVSKAMRDADKEKAKPKKKKAKKAKKAKKTKKAKKPAKKAKKPAKKAAKKVVKKAKK